MEDKEKKRRFLCKTESYDKFLYNEVYDEDYMGRGSTALACAQLSPNDWQEVFEEEKELTFPRMMLCGDSKDESTWIPERVIYIEKEFEMPFPVRVINKNNYYKSYSFAKELPPVKTITKEDAFEVLRGHYGCDVIIKNGDVLIEED